VNIYLSFFLVLIGTILIAIFRPRNWRSIRASAVVRQDDPAARQGRMARFQGLMFGIAFLFIGLAFIADMIWIGLQVDRCLDDGGRWNYAVSVCEH